ncbi:hypothetical protein ACHAWC_004460, partial [Mediolabrus comicus]
MVEANTSIDKIPALTLDEVFVKKATGPQTPNPRLTPLSKKACKIHGIDPIVLLHRDHASFGESNLDPEIQTMRYEAYSFTRDKLFSLAKQERSKLLANCNTSQDSVSVSVASIVSSNSGREATLIENEKKRLEKMAARQKKELLRLLSFEKKSQDIMAKMQTRAEEQKKKEARARHDKRRRELHAAEQARQRELRRKLEEEKQEHLRRIAL